MAAEGSWRLLRSHPCDALRSGDFLRTLTDADDDMQMFWQAFPAEGGAARTTYMFTFADCDKRRPSLKVDGFQLTPPHCLLHLNL